MKDELHQWMTPAWAAERLYELYFSHLTSADVVVDPTCGDGAFLAAVPQDIFAFGIEIDPIMAARAADNAGRGVVIGDCRTAKVPQTPTAIIGNPPFRVKLIEALMTRAGEWLQDGMLMGLLLPTYMFQTAERTLRYRERWEIKADHMPRNLYPRLQYPLVFATFKKGGRLLVGFSLFEECYDVKQMRQEHQDELRIPGRTWYMVVHAALHEAGGKADLETIYALVEPRRPTGNKWWKEKVRQQLRRFNRVEPGVYAVAA